MLKHWYLRISTHFLPLGFAWTKGATTGLFGYLQVHGGKHRSDWNAMTRIHNIYIYVYIYIYVCTDTYVYIYICHWTTKIELHIQKFTGLQQTTIIPLLYHHYTTIPSQTWTTDLIRVHLLEGSRHGKSILSWETSLLSVPHILLWDSLGSTIKIPSGTIWLWLTVRHGKSQP